MLHTGELCVCQITAVLELAPSTVSAHLKELRLAGVTAERKDGRWVHVRLSDHPDVRPWIEAALVAVSEDRQVAADRRLLAELRTVSVEDLCRVGLNEAVLLAGRAHPTGP
jgi:DNA-binding transcriptional ArsR family regulator